MREPSLDVRPELGRWRVLFNAPDLTVRGRTLTTNGNVAPIKVFKTDNGWKIKIFGYDFKCIVDERADSQEDAETKADNHPEVIKRYRLRAVKK